MKTFRGKTAVITGAASGIGRALAERLAAEGMSLVLADIEEELLNTVAAKLDAAGTPVLAQATDVSERSSVDALAAAAFERFGVPHVLCNNAGVSGGMGALWEASPQDWEWVLGVNLMGVVHGVAAFVPAMVEADHDGHIINTSSVLGLSTGSGSIYGVSKHAVTRLTEGLWYDLAAAGSRLGVSVLCPGMVATRIVSARRNRPGRFLGPDDSLSDEAEQFTAALEQRFLTDGMDPAEVADQVVAAIGTDQFYILTHPEMILPEVEARLGGIMGGQNPPPARPFGLLD